MLERRKSGRKGRLIDRRRSEPGREHLIYLLSAVVEQRSVRRNQHVNRTFKDPRAAADDRLLVRPRSPREPNTRRYIRVSVQRLWFAVHIDTKTVVERQPRRDLPRVLGK